MKAGMHVDDQDQTRAAPPKARAGQRQGGPTGTFSQGARATAAR